MSGSIDTPLTGPQPRFTFGAARSVPTDNAGPRLSFALLILFLVLLYSNIAQVFPALESVRPALVVALAAVFLLVVELGASRQHLRLTWPQGYLLLAFIGIAGVS